MTFTEIVNAAAERLDLTSAEALARIGRHVNAYYKRLTSSIGLQPSRRTIVQATATLGVQTLTFTGIEKIHHVEDRSSGSTRLLREVSTIEIAEGSIGDGQPTAYAIDTTGAGTVTIRMNTIPQAAFTLFAEGLNRAATLAGTDEPAFPESYHDLLVSAAVYEERLKQEKPQLASIARAEYEDRAGDLRLFIAKSAQQDIFQGKRPGSTFSGAGSTSGGSSNGSSSYTQSGLITFDRTSAAPGSRAPFAVAAGSEKVVNLDADTLDGLDSTAFFTAAQFSAQFDSHRLRHESGGADAIKLDALAAPDDTVNLNVSSLRHGLAPKLPNDASKFLDGTGTYSVPNDTSKAPLASPALTGTPTAPTAAIGTNTTQLATTAFAMQQRETVVALTDGVTPALDASLGTVFTLTAAGNRTIAVPTNARAGQKIIIRHLASGADRTLALNTGAGGFRFGTDITALTATTSGKTDYIGCIYNATDSKWDVVAVTKGF